MNGVGISLGFDHSKNEDVNGDYALQRAMYLAPDYL